MLKSLIKTEHAQTYKHRLQHVRIRLLPLLSNTTTLSMSHTQSHFTVSTMGPLYCGRKKEQRLQPSLGKAKGCERGRGETRDEGGLLLFGSMNSPSGCLKISPSDHSFCLLPSLSAKCNTASTEQLGGKHLSGGDCRTESVCDSLWPCVYVVCGHFKKEKFVVGEVTHTLKRVNFQRNISPVFKHQLMTKKRANAWQSTFPHGNNDNTSVDRLIYSSFLGGHL